MQMLMRLNPLKTPVRTRPRAQNEWQQLLRRPPPPLIDPKSRLIVLFSAKSACTNVVIWFLHQIGHAKAARDYNEWPHRYRLRVYYPSQLYLNAARHDLSSFRVIRVVRDPYQRAASTFRHVLRFDTGFKEFGIRAKGLSFSEFLDALERMDLTDCNSHYAIQRHPLEDRLKVHHLINVSRENMFERLNAIEEALGLRRTSLANDSWIESVAGRHNSPTATLRAAEALDTRRLTREEARQGPWPSYDALLTASTRARIAKLYAADIDAYLAERTT